MSWDGQKRMKKRRRTAGGDTHLIGRCAILCVSARSASLSRRYALLSVVIVLKFVDRLSTITIFTDESQKKNFHQISQLILTNQTFSSTAN